MRVHELSPPEHGSGTRERLARSSWFPTLAVILACLVITLVSLPRAIQAGDAGEFATIMLAGGVPHPPGYPWMRMLGPLARLLFALGLPPACAAALPPGLAGVAAWALLHRICVQLDPSRLGAWLGALLIVLVASSPLVVTHVPDSEVWGPHLLFCSLFLRAASRRELRATNPAGARQHAFQLGLWLGLAVSHHLTAIFLLPLAIASALPDRVLDRPALIVQGLLGIAGSLIGLLPLLSLALGGGGAWRWGETQTAAGLFHHVSRADYGTTSLSLHEDSVAVGDAIARALASLGEVFSAGLIHAPVFGALVLLACGLALRPRARPTERASEGPPLRFTIGLLLSLLVASIGFASVQNIDPNLASGAWILERFDLLPSLLIIPLLVLGLGGLFEAARARLGEVRPALLSSGAIAIALMLLVAQLGSLRDHGRPADDRSIEAAALDLVRTPDPAGPPLPDTDRGQGPIRAIVIGTDDHRSFPVLYVQSVLGEGSHTLYIDAILFTQPWYRAQIRRRFPELPDVDMPLKLIGALWSDPRLDDVPIYLANVFSKPASQLTTVPEGLLWRVVPPRDHPVFVADQWTTDAVLARHLAACERMSVRASDFPPLDSDRDAWTHPWSNDLRFAYVEKAHALALVLQRSGDTSASASAVEKVMAALRTRTGVALDSGR